MSFSGKMRRPSHRHDSFYVPLERLSSKSDDKATWFLGKVQQAMMGFFLLDRFQIKMIAVWIATYHYVPLLAFILAILINCILHLFFSFVFPVLRDRYHWSMYTWEDVKEIPLAHDAVRAFVVVLSHLSILVGIAVIGYKLISVVTDAIIDSCLVSYDETAQCNVGFYRLLQKYQLLLALRYARFVALVLSCCISLFLAAIFSSDTLIHWEHQGNDTFYFFVTTISVLLAGVIWSYHQKVDDPFGTSMTRWWRKAIPLLRRFYLYVFSVYSGRFFWSMGCKHGLARFCEGMLYISMLHVVLLLASQVTLSLYSLVICTMAAARNPTRRYGLFYCVIPLTALVFFSFAPFSTTLFSVRVICVCWVLNSVVKRWYRLDSEATPQEEESFSGTENEKAPSHTKSDKTIRPDGDRWAKTYPRRRHGVLLRAFHRVFLTAAVVVVLGLALWVSVKHPGFHGATPTRCEGDSSGEAIRVTARYMVADLYGLRTHEDPKKLVYESDETRYDSARHAGLCMRLWGTDLFAGDLAYFSLMTYLRRDSSDFSTMLNFYRRYRDGASDWVALPTNHSYGRAVFRHLYSASKDTSVIAVRGTDITSPFDFLQNLLLFSETFFFKLLANFLPLSGFIPESIIVDYVAASSVISSMLFGGLTKDYYHLHVEDYLNTIKSKHIILTGHSLGGVVAQIVAARKHLPGVAFSSPGINFMRKKFNIDSDAIDGFTTNVIVSNDFTVDIDTPSGTVYHIQCEHQTAEVCHSIELHAIRMWTVCPSYRARTLLNGTYKLTGEEQNS